MTHNIEKLRERFHHLLDVLVKDYDFGRYIDGCCPEDLDCSWEGYDEAAENLGIWTGSGATKFVIGDDNCDYIIKFCPNEPDYDYCGREVEIYREAEKRGYADKFAWCDYLFDYEFNDYYTLPIYVMEWCQCSYELIDDEMDDWHYTKYCTSRGIDKKADGAYEDYTSNYRYNKEFDEKMMEWAFDVWGLNYNQPGDYGICQFMRDMFINDIHAGNWGWLNNKLVLVDYSGYGDCETCRSINY